MPGMQADAAQAIADYVIDTEELERGAATAAKLTRNSLHGPWHRQLEEHRQNQSGLRR
jgi:hypothetical protein